MRGLTPFIPITSRSQAIALYSATQVLECNSECISSSCPHLQKICNLCDWTREGKRGLFGLITIWLHPDLVWHVFVDISVEPFLPGQWSGVSGIISLYTYHDYCSIPLLMSLLSHMFANPRPHKSAYTFPTLLSSPAPNSYFLLSKTVLASSVQS